MAKPVGGVPVAGYMSPTDTSDTYAVTDEFYNRGGYRTVENETELSQITDDRKKKGMLVYIWETKKLQQWDGTSWKDPEGIGSGSGDGEGLNLPFTSSTTAPNSPKNGDVWFNPSTGEFKVYNDTGGEQSEGIWESQLDKVKKDLEENYAKKDDVTKILKFKGTVETKENLPKSEDGELEHGDAYAVKDENGAWYFWNADAESGGAWEEVDGPNIDTSKIVNTDETQDISGKKTFINGLTIGDTVQITDDKDVPSLGKVKELIKDIEGADGILYTNSEGTTAALGGIPAGTTFENKTIKEMFDLLLYPYQTPAFTSLSTNFNKTYEVGESTETSITITWATSNQSNIKENSLKFTVNGTEVSSSSSNLPKSGNQAFTISALKKDSDGTIPVKAELEDVKNKKIEKTANITWKSAIYYGTSDESVLDSAKIVALTGKLLDSNWKRSYSFGGGGYKYVCILSSLGNATNFYNTDNNLPVPMEKLTDVSVTNAHSVTQTYSVYRSTNVLGGAINITFG